MNLLRRVLIAAAIGTPLLVAGCAATAPAVDPAVARVLAPTGTLRVGVYPGSPTSLVVNPKTGERAGVAMELGQALGNRLGVPVQVFEFGRLALVLDALKAGAVDFTFTNATEARAKDMAFTPPVIRLELGYLVPPGSAITAVGDVDLRANRVGVAEGSSSQGVLTRTFKQAVVVPVASIKLGQELLRQGKLDAFATNKGILFDMSDDLPGFRVLDGRWGLENLAIAIPKGREAALPYVGQFAQDVQASGQLQAIITRAGLRGTARPD
ncbi:MAG: transporter substrate-binding domain-containing protein [Comamonadaceae bacterium]|uniref:transporter substrate-binding domain-containing protein n=1 Tax=Candidatus Skiveiella danica TaxID=3386177 RepID=UPI00390A2EA3|nr:transporter substrate-binding domain-containing protein [Comamonadaceae bacterium]